MKIRKPAPRIPDAQLSDAALDAALRDDTILPSSGFAASVMSAVESQSASSAALAFPWKRALPGLAAVVVVLILLLGVLIAAAVRAVRAPVHLAAPTAAAASTTADWQAQLLPLLHSSTLASGAFWGVLALVFSGLCLLFCRRLITSA